MLLWLLFADISLAAPAARWLTGRDALPAVAAGAGQIAAAKDDNCRWVTRGSRWQEIGNLGERLGEIKVRKLEISEPWPCKMADFRQRDETRLLLEVAARPPLPTPAWHPSQAEQHEFLRRLGRPQYHDPELLFFNVGNQHWALGMGRRMLVGWLDSAWHTQTLSPPQHEYCDKLAAVDLDGDGRPEIIVECGEDTVYRDVIFKLFDDAWAQVAESLWGNTI
jgi:hypothetical protein